MSRHYRTTIVDVATEQTQLNGPELYELADTTLSATEAAIKSSHNLLHWDEYKKV